jgi:hypothetical protein
MWRHLAWYKCATVLDGAAAFHLHWRRHLLPEYRAWGHTTHPSPVVFKFISLSGSTTRWDEGKVVPVRAMKASVGRRGTAPPVLNVWRYIAALRQRNDPVTHLISGWVGPIGGLDLRQPVIVFSEVCAYKLLVVNHCTWKCTDIEVGWSVGVGNYT